MPHTFLRQFLLKAYQNLYVKPQPSNKEFIQGRWQQQLLTFNTKGFKCHSFCSVKYSVLTGNNQQTLFKKKTTKYFTYFKFELNVTYRVA